MRLPIYGGRILFFYTSAVSMCAETYLHNLTEITAVIKILSTFVYDFTCQGGQVI